MKPSENAYKLIKEFENLRCKAYKALPSEKYYTIGYGHYSADVKKNQYITVKQAEELLQADVAEYCDKLNEFPWLEQNQFDALCSLIFNIGWYNFRHNYIWTIFKNCHQTSSLLDCARRMTLYVRAGGQILYGLQKRRCIEANHFLGYERFEVVGGSIIEHEPAAPLLARPLR